VIDGVWYSKDSVAEDTYVAVYGTLKKGMSNYWNYLTNSTFIGNGKTAHKYPLLISGLPYLIEENGLGHNVEVDIFTVTGTVLEKLDMLEGHPTWYKRKQVMIDTKQGEKLCWVYFNIREKVKPDSVFHKKYDVSRYGYGGYYGRDWYGGYYGRDWYGNAKTTPKAIPETVSPTPKKEGQSYEEWWDNYPVHPKKQTPLPTVTDAFDSKPLTTDKWKKMTKATKEKEYCRACWSMLEHDTYGNYYCHECNDWRAGFEIVRF
jgi:gamma-glutamylaminecyclotransferase